jgi:DNA-binding MarR family transcriptional regulator
VRLTDRGRVVEQVVRATIQEIEEEWAARMGADEYAQLTHLLRKLIALMEE